jgi:hypothetical protein
MMQMQYVDNGKERIAEIEVAGWEAVQRCTVFLWTECVKATGISNPRPYITPSQPGEPPRLRTGHGQRNITYELDPAKGIGRVGVRVNAIYMAYLDQGTRRVLPRPWLLATAIKFRKQLEAIASKP